MSGMGRLEGKVAVVTGGSRGLGRGIAEGFGAEGARVVVNYLKDEDAARGQARDVLVNNAGMLNSFKLADMSVDTWDSMIKVHLRGMFLCTRFAIPHMLNQKSGKIINMTSIVGRIGSGGAP